MTKKKEPFAAKAFAAKGPNPEPVQCHFISNTHWDREWRYSAQRTRHMLVYLLDMLFDIFEKEPGFKYFHLDSQTMPLQDYLEARPEQESVARKYVSEGRLQAEFTLPAGHGRKWHKVRLVTLEELPERNLDLEKDGWAYFEITKKRILTVEFLP